MRKLLFLLFLIPIFGFSQSPDGTFKTLTATMPTTDNYVISEALPASYDAKEKFIVVFPFANAGTSPTLNRNSLGAKAIKNEDGTSPAIGAICACRKLVSYNGTYFQLIGGGGASGSAGGDLSGTYPNPTVAKINGSSVPTGIISGDLLLGSGANSFARLPAITSLGSPRKFLVSENSITQYSNIYETDLANQSALSVVGNGTTSISYGSDLVSSAADQVLRVNSANTTLGFGAINLASSNAVTGILSAANGGTGGTGGGGTVTSVSFTGGLISISNPTTTPAFTVAGTSGGIPYFSSTSTWASSGLLAANALMIGGGAGTSPSTTTTGTGILTFLGTPSSANEAAALTDETGTGADVFAGSPAFTGTPTLGTLGYSDTGILWSWQSSTAGYNQVIIQNTSNGSTASTNFIVSNDAGTSTTHYGEFGKNSSGFTGSGSWQIANATYLDDASDDVAIGTLANKPLHFFTNSVTTDRLQIDGNGNFVFNQSVQSGSNIFQTLTQAAHTGGSPNGISFVGGAHTTLADAEASDIIINLGRTVQFTGSSTPGAANFASQRSIKISPATYSFSSTGAQVITTANTIELAPPIASTHAAFTTVAGLNILTSAVGTATNAYGAFIAAPSGATNNFALGLTGNATMTGNMTIGGSLTVTGSFAPSGSFQSTQMGTVSSYLQLFANTYTTGNGNQNGEFYQGGNIRGGVTNAFVTSFNSAYTSVVGVVSGLNTLVGGSGYTNGSYNPTSMTGGTGTGLSCNITVSGGAVTACVILTSNSGINYTVGDVLSASIPGGSGFTITVSAVDFTGAVLNAFTDNRTLTDSKSINSYWGFYSDPAVNITSARSGNIGFARYSPSITATGSFNRWGLIIDNAVDLSGFGTSAPNSTVSISGSLALNYVAKTGTYGIGATDYLIDCTSNSFTVTLPTAVGITGRVYVIKNSGTATTITIATTSSQTIDGAAPGVLTTAVPLKVMSDGANWKTTY